MHLTLVRFTLTLLEKVLDLPTIVNLLTKEQHSCYSCWPIIMTSTSHIINLSHWQQPNSTSQTKFVVNSQSWLKRSYRYIHARSRDRCCSFSLPMLCCSDTHFQPYWWLLMDVGLALWLCSLWYSQSQIRPVLVIGKPTSWVTPSSVILAHSHACEDNIVININCCPGVGLPPLRAGTFYHH